MKSKRVPDRVHVVRPPENDGHIVPQDGRSVEIVRMLAKISDKLKRSEAERYELLNELREYRKGLKDLEEKSDNSEKAYLALENKLSTKGSIDTESLQRQARFEKSLKITEEKMIKAVAGQALMDKRLKDTEDRQTVIDQRLDESLAEQTRLNRQLELQAQDKTRILRKIERLEEIVTDTQAAMKSKAMVLLTDQNAKAQSQSLAAPIWAKEGVQAETSAQVQANTNGDEEVDASSEQPLSTTTKIVGTTALLVVALFAGWYINQLQRPDLPQLSVTESSDIQAMTQGGATQPSTEQSPRENIAAEQTTPISQGQTTPAALAPDETPENVLDYSDEQLMEALNNDAEGLAAQLNAIEPGAANAQEETAQVTPVAATVSLENAQITAPMENFDAIAFQQDPEIQKAVDAERSNAPLLSRMQPDSQLPPSVRQIEAQAFQGNGEAQHDLAAIYTAGHAGVDQNFEKAAFWFREASENNIANARYNLGVLYHQGLGRDRNLDRALYWYREAANLNHAEAQYNLGIAHIEGIGTEYNPRLAAAFFEKAANNGIMEAAYNLGLIYENGLLGEANTNEALMWYKIAADQGSQDAKLAMEQLATNLQIDMQDIDKLVERMQQINESVKGRRAGPAATQQQPASTTSVEQRRAMIAQVQEYLILSELYDGPADGIIGPQTEQAIREYQNANGLEATGKVSESLLGHMVNSAVAKINANR